MNSKQIVTGWREWVCLPELGIDNIKAKIDTGARTSSLHAFDLKPLQKNGACRLQFKIHPVQQDEVTILNCEADVYDERWITDSGGHRELRFVIKTPIILDNMTWVIEMTLTNRDTMGFRMLLGRAAMGDRLVVDPSRSFLVSSEKG
jgi:hypothetical protein